MTIDEAMIHAYEFGNPWDDYTQEAVITLAAEVQRLQAEVTALRLYAPARRAQPTVKTAPIAPPNLAFFGIAETDEEFAERAGRKVTEVVR